MKRILILLFILGFLLLIGLWAYRYFFPNKPIEVKKVFSAKPAIGQVIDSLDGVYVYYNGNVSHVEGRNTVDGYNLGLKYQCVEFVKRYYFEHYHHKMPDSWGHAKDFFDASVPDGKLNVKRNLLQFTNPSARKPQKGDLLVFKGTRLNSYGHVAIVAQVFDDAMVLIQQNPGPFAKSRIRIPIKKLNGKFKLVNQHIVGWLRMK